MRSLLVSTLALLPALAGCDAKSAPPAGASDAPAITAAMCVIRPTAGNETSGVITFKKEGDGIRIQARISGLTPGKHGFHVHEWGNVDCTDGKCTGGHFNPDGVDHAGPDAATRHVGDLGNLEAGEDGSATYDRLDEHVAFSGRNSIIGRAIIVHADPDDLASQPTGNAGARVGYGVIGIMDPATAK